MTLSEPRRDREESIDHRLIHDIARIADLSDMPRLKTMIEEISEDLMEGATRIQEDAKQLDLQEAQIAELRIVVSTCAKAFREYEEIHKAKGTTEGNAKAMTNAKLAELCENNLSPSGTEAAAVLKTGLERHDAFEETERQGKSVQDPLPEIEFYVEKEQAHSDALAAYAAARRAKG